MEKLELKHIVGYLPYGLKVKSINIFENDPVFELDLDTGNAIQLKAGIKWVLKDNFKPILRPLSDLTKEIEVNGEKFVPIVELFKIGINVKDITVKNARFEFKDNAYQLTVSDNKNKDIVFAFDLNDNSFGTFYHNVTYSVFNQFQLFQKLYEYHFDIYSLIESGLAIDLNTLK